MDIRSRPRCTSLLTLSLAGLFFATGSLAQDAPPAPQQQPTGGDYCKSAVGPTPHADVLVNFCGWVLSFDKRLPDIIGDQETHRYNTENGKDRKLIDTTSARIAYLHGRSRYSDLAVNHVKVKQSEDAEMLQIVGAWSYGDYGQDLRLLFRNHASTQFSFASEGEWQTVPVYIFNYQVPDNHWWQLKAREAVGKPLQVAWPAYHGRILIAKKDSTLVHFERETTTIEKGFPLRYGANAVDYKSLPLGDGSSFVLPTKSTVTFCHDDKHRKCEINEATFTNWQKFGAKTRILTDTETE